MVEIRGTLSKTGSGVFFEDELLIHIQHLFTELTQSGKAEQNHRNETNGSQASLECPPCDSRNVDCENAGGDEIGKKKKRGIALKSGVWVRKRNVRESHEQNLHENDDDGIENELRLQRSIQTT